MTGGSGFFIGGATEGVNVIVNGLPPEIFCAPDVTVFADFNACSASNVNLGLPVVSNFCGTYTLTNDVAYIEPKARVY